MARPTKLTPETQERIIQALKAGNYREPTARSAGIAPSTLYSWLERGEADVEQGKATIYAEFVEAVRRAEGDAEVHAVAVLRRAMMQDWRAAAEYLKRRHPDRWSALERVQHSGKVDHEHDLIVTDPEVAEALRLARDRLAATRGE